MKHVSPSCCYVSNAVPHHTLPNMLRNVTHLSRRCSLHITGIFRTKSNGVRPLVLFSTGRPNRFTHTRRLNKGVLRLYIRINNDVDKRRNVKHRGVGRVYTRFGDSRVAAFRTIGTTFSPSNLLGPKGGVPALRHYTRFNTVRIRRNRLPFPRLRHF